MLLQDGSVKKCLIASADDLSPSCKKELGRSMYMAFFVWQPQGLLTAPCDDDIQMFCLSRLQEVTPGAVQVCLSEIVSVCWTHMHPNGKEDACCVMLWLAALPSASHLCSNHLKGGGGDMHHLNNRLQLAAAVVCVVGMALK